ncbi:DegQ family serine endoprotease [Benzoatithermus flavus]|uniref:Probable periplasmic serine endoprotease DegP-like n=1 Tax=Benzoatithermus flavus TaxID=3108223 RepID=A0ABU8XM53_9PROT
MRSAIGPDDAGRQPWMAGVTRRVLLAVALGLLLLGDATGVWAQQKAPAEGFADIVAKVAPAVVNVSTRKEVSAQSDQPDVPMPQFPPGSPFEEFFKDFFDRDRQREQQAPRRSFSLGSGFVIDPSGYVVTNNHVIAEADEITVAFNNDREYPAKLVGRDTKTDLALLKIEGDQPFPYVEWADSDQIRVGDWMIAIGNPFGLGSTVTAGIVSARGRDIRAGPYDDFIQVDAAINRGNSGGPSFTLDGKVFGVNTAIFSPSGGNVGIGFAIPANLARPVIESLMRSGRVARGWLGVRIQTVTDEIAESLGLPETRGALVASVTSGGPAASAQIQPGDVILEFDGKKVDRMRSLPRLVAETAIGKEVDVKVWRRGEQKDFHVVLGELPDDEQLAELGQGQQQEQPQATAIAKVDALGVTVSTISPDLKSQYNLDDDAKGVVITDVSQGSPAAEENLRPGDLIVEIGQEEVSSPPEVMAKVNQAKRESKKSILLLVNRQGDLRFVALKLKD